MTTCRRPLALLPALWAGTAALSASAEIIVTSGEPAEIPLVIHNPAPMAPPVVVMVTPPSLLAPLPAGTSAGYAAPLSNQSNIDRMLWRSDLLRGSPQVTGGQTIILLSK